MLPGAWIGGAELFDDGRALALARMARHQTCFRWVSPEGWQEPIRWGRDFVGDVCAVDEVTVTWPGGELVRYTGVPANYQVTLTQGGTVRVEGWEAGADEE